MLSEKLTGGHEYFEDALLYADGSVDSFSLSEGTLTLRRYNPDLDKIVSDVRIEGEYDEKHDIIVTTDGGYMIVSIL